ncbi:MAG: capsid protein [Chaetfec virus UA24_7381]|nr:MAG: capsid protein [Chaetfec virus UA24_7381]
MRLFRRRRSRYPARRYRRVFKRRSTRRYRRRYTRIRRRSNTKSSSRSFNSTSIYTISPAGAKDKPRGYVPIGIYLSDLPGFSEYEYTYSRVRVLSVTVYLVNGLAGVDTLMGGYAYAPSYDLLQSIIQVPGGATVNASLVYRNTIGRTSEGIDGYYGQFYGFRVGGNVYEANTVPVDLNGVDKANTTGGSTIEHEVTYVGTQFNTERPVVVPSEGVKPEVSGPARQGLQVDVPITLSTPEFDLPFVSMSQLQQVKRYKVLFPNESKRRIKFTFVPFYFTSSNGPVGDLTLRAVPRYSSSRRWMPMEWFSTSSGRQPMVLFGPYLAPLFNQVDETQPLTLSLYYHVRLQFAGQV